MAEAQAKLFTAHVWVRPPDHRLNTSCSPYPIQSGIGFQLANLHAKWPVLQTLQQLDAFSHLTKLQVMTPRASLPSGAGFQ